jgi:addiction module HigA family antidote
MKAPLSPNPHPGEILAEDFLKPLGISQYRLAKSTGIPQSRVSRLIMGKVSVTADTAFRLGLYFGVSPQNWLNLQNAFDLMEFERHAAARIRQQVTPLVHATAINSHPESLSIAKDPSESAAQLIMGEDVARRQRNTLRETAK